eukprot:TRINITY_DN12883_c0_g3_i1.p1 TRINITY_DN12883_c0_g3~~TRINITY_DN12883_c0_g3_i1.p1  ORF type:complete len:534 (+),score=70.07 TRINITY_DN12883_c0_g3_i1:150-1751(+)
MPSQQISPDHGDGRQCIGSRSDYRRVSFFRRPIFVFFLLIGASIFVNFDSGGTAAILVLLSKGCKNAQSLGTDEFQYAYDPAYPCLDPAEEGILGGVPYVGLVVGCPIASMFLSSCSPKKVLLVGLWLNAASTMVFAVMLNKWYLWGAKFVVGLSQSVISVYAPVWVAMFAPMSVRTLWYGFMQSACAIGSLVGYGVVGYLVDLGVFYQYAFMIQAFALIGISLITLFVENNRIDANEGKNSLDAGDADAMHPSLREALLLPGHTDFEESVASSFVEQDSCTNNAITSVGTELIHRKEEPVVKRGANGLMVLANGAFQDVLVLAKVPLFVSTVVSICALCFVVTGIQLWTSAYFSAAFHRPRSEVTTLFVIAAGSAPILGVVIGSGLVDALGGYDTLQSRAHSCLLLVCFGIMGGLAAMGVVLLQPDPSDHTRFFEVLVCIWLLLFFGGSILPAVTGISLAAVPKELRTAASSLSMMAYNIFGYGLGAYIPGQVAKFESLAVAMQVVCSGAIITFVGLIASYRIAVRAAQRPE